MLLLATRATVSPSTTLVQTEISQQEFHDLPQIFVQIFVVLLTNPLNFFSTASTRLTFLAISEIWYRHS